MRHDPSPRCAAGSRARRARRRRGSRSPSTACRRRARSRRRRAASSSGYTSSCSMPVSPAAMRALEQLAEQPGRAGATSFRKPDRLARQLVARARRRARCSAPGRRARGASAPRPCSATLPSSRKQFACGERDQARDHRRRAEDVGVHHEHGPVERLARGPEREDRALAVARVHDAARPRTPAGRRRSRRAPRRRRSPPRRRRRARRPPRGRRAGARAGSGRRSRSGTSAVRPTAARRRLPTPAARMIAVTRRSTSPSASRKRSKSGGVEVPHVGDAEDLAREPPLPLVDDEAARLEARRAASA